MKKYAFVTGGTKGIGRAAALKLAGMGYNLLLNYNSDEERAQQTREEVAACGVEAELLRFHVGDSAMTAQALGSWLQANPDKLIEVLVNNAGIRHDSLLVFMKEEQWRNLLEINLSSFFTITSMLLKPMVLNRYGRIITLSSMSAIRGVAGQTAYSASKAALLGATRALAQEVGTKNITVNAVVPGFIRTDMTKELDESVLKSQNALKRFGEPEEVAELIGFLASRASSFITGQSLIVDGGCQ